MSDVECASCGRKLDTVKDDCVTVRIFDKKGNESSEEVFILHPECEKIGFWKFLRREQPLLFLIIILLVINIIIWSITWV